MADNIIKRIIQMVLDKESAKKTQEDANAVAGGIDKAWKEMASRVAGYLGAAFLISKIVGFGKAAVSEAMESQAAWTALKGTVDATGVSFDAMSDKIHASADAFQDATIHDDDAFAVSLTRMISLTGDTAASLNNMGLVANVAAQFFKGDLESATNLVSKAMNGNVTALQKMGIHAKNAQDALDILATRSMGAATREAGTFNGQLKQMDELWKDDLKDFGNAIIASDGTTSAITVLRAAIQVFGQWIAKNKDNIRVWVTEGIKFAIDATDVFIRAVWGMTNVIGGGFTLSLGLATQAVAKLMLGLVKAREVIDVVQEFLKIGDPKKAKATTQALEDQARALEEWGKSLQELGADKVHKGIATLSTPLFSSEQFTGLPKIPPLQVNKPRAGANAVTDASQAVEKALKQFQEDAKAAANMQQVLGDKFDATAAEIERTTKLLNVLASFGIDPASVGMADLSTRLTDLVTNIKPTEDASKALAKALATDLAQGAIAATNAVDQLKQRQADTLNAIKALLDAGLSPTSKAVTDLTTRYNDLTNAIIDATKIQHLAEVYRALGDEIRSGLFMATLDSANELDKLKIRQQALQKAMQTLLSQGIKPQDKALQELAAQYRDVSSAIKEQTVVMQLQAAAADFLADALGTAMQGGLHEAASQKAKQNAIEAAEMLVRAGAFALFGDFPQASAALVLAGQFAGIAAAWGIMAASTHGSSGGGGGVAISSGGGSGASSAGSDLSSSRASSNDSASRAEQPTAEVSVYLVGPGFDALNPEVQRIVWGAQQQAEELYGPNARIRIRSQRP
jgi:hypothetical protein